MLSTQQTRQTLEAAGLVEGLSVQEVDSRLAVGVRHQDCSQRVVAFYLAEVEERDLAQQYGYAKTWMYAEGRHGLSRRRSRELIQLGKTLRELPAIDRAFCEQKIGWSKVVRLAKVAVAEHDEAWLERALQLTVRGLEELVARSEPGKPPRKEGDKRGLDHIRFSVRARVPALTHRKWDLAKQKLSDELGHAVTEAELIDTLSELLLNLEADGTVEGKKRVDASLYHIDLYEDEDRVLCVDTKSGPVPVGEGECACAHCDEKTPTALRRRVLRRDGLRCACCGGRFSLHAHHIRFRSQGGPTRMANLITLCTRCHGLVHDELLVLEGDSAAAIAFHDTEGHPLHAPGGTVDPAAILKLIPPEKVEFPAEPEPALLDELPASIDRLWWRRNAHRMHVHGGMGLALRPGTPLPETEEEDEPSTLEPVPFAKAFEGIVGQEERLRRFEETMIAARKRGRSFPHTVFLGPSGTGKTTMAKGLASACGSRLIRAVGRGLQTTHALIGTLAELREHDVLFLDEVHAVPQPVLESLYEAMAEGQVSLTVHGPDGRTKAVRLALPSFTLLAATTEQGDLHEALINRFGLEEHFAPYGQEELATIACAQAAADDVDLTRGAGQRLADVGRGVPRKVLRLLERVVDRAVARDEGKIERTAVDEVLESLGYDADGLDVLDRRYMAELRNYGGAVSLARLASALDTSRRALMRTVEPYLIQKGFMRITPRGRVVGGRAHPGPSGTPRPKFAILSRDGPAHETQFCARGQARGGLR